MPKNKRPVPRKPAKQAEEPDHDALAQNLVDLALEIAEREDLDPTTLAAREQDLTTLVRRLLRRGHDEVLHGAVELGLYTGPECGQYLRERVEEEAATLLVRGDGEAEFEIDAFMIPLFVHSTGGLRPDEVFADDDAYAALVDSFRAGGLASADTRIVLVRHLYDLDSVDRVRYSELQDMLREAAHVLRSRKLAGAPAIEASMRPWRDAGYAPDEDAMQLRFLLGFALKRADDPFYRVPADEQEAEAYFEARLARYRVWAGTNAALLQRCLARDPATLDLNFLYQDLFYGAKRQGLAELAMLATLADVNLRLDEQERTPERIKAVVAPVEIGDAAWLRINLYPLDGGAPLATVDKPLEIGDDIEGELEDLCDALGTLGLDGVLLARGFDDAGEPVGAEPYLST
ncbi:hypothetical protein [uncultured Massilia sp.]|uniref:hypothetical protein n=1 Tax=uncultured Massilia sp. TaxID=169973 RepID=UPI0025DBD844|nr:hypothetical protein [uncultured Massilia sp.]